MLYAGWTLGGCPVTKRTSLAGVAGGGDWAVGGKCCRKWVPVVVWWLQPQGPLQGISPARKQSPGADGGQWHWGLPACGWAVMSSAAHAVRNSTGKKLATRPNRQGWATCCAYRDEAIGLESFRCVVHAVPENGRRWSSTARYLSWALGMTFGVRDRLEGEIQGEVDAQLQAGCCLCEWPRGPAAETGDASRRPSEGCVETCLPPSMRQGITACRHSGVRERDSSTSRGHSRSSSQTHDEVDEEIVT